MRAQLLPTDTVPTSADTGQATVDTRWYVRGPGIARVEYDTE
ncbi:hypothetical protein [Actinokineospora globicatena]|nr:hypothetical protein [Actinokineospora globicatena]